MVKPKYRDRSSFQADGIWLANRPPKDRIIKKAEAPWVIKSGNWAATKGQAFYIPEVFANFSLGGGYYVFGAVMNIVYVAAVYIFVWDHRLYTIPVNALTIILAFFVQEFCYYWYHRTAHRVRWFWSQHVSHHSGEIMNLSLIHIWRCRRRLRCRSRWSPYH